MLRDIAIPCSGGIEADSLNNSIKKVHFLKKSLDILVFSS